MGVAGQGGKPAFSESGDAGLKSHPGRCRVRQEQPPTTLPRVPQPQPHFIRGPRWAATLNFRIPPSRVYVVGTPLAASRICAVRAHIAPGKLGSATPTRISLALACPRINRRSPPGVHVRANWRARPSVRPEWESALAASLRYTMTEERDGTIRAIRAIIASWRLRVRRHCRSR
jgi:hypothetical protein